MRERHEGRERGEHVCARMCAGVCVFVRLCDYVCMCGKGLVCVFLCVCFVSLSVCVWGGGGGAAPVSKL